MACRHRMPANAVIWAALAALQLCGSLGLSAAAAADAASSSLPAAAAASGATAGSAAVRLWLDTVFFLDGEVDILKDIVANSSGTVVGKNGKTGEVGAQGTRQASCCVAPSLCTHVP